MATLGEITVAVQRQFGDDTEAQITAADIMRWANEAQLEIARKTDALLTSTTIPSVIGTAEYNLPVDFLRVDRVSYNGASLPRTTVRDLDRTFPNRNVTPVVNATPTRYFVRRKRVGVYPSPDSVKDITVEYTARPADLTVPGSISTLPVEFHPDIVRFCLARAYELDGDATQSGKIMAEFTERLAFDLDEATNPVADTYPSIRDDGY